MAHLSIHSRNNGELPLIKLEKKKWLRLFHHGSRGNNGAQCEKRTVVDVDPDICASVCAKIIPVRAQYQTRRLIPARLLPTKYATHYQKKRWKRLGIQQYRLHCIPMMPCLMVPIHHPPHCLQRPLIQPFPAAQTVDLSKLDLQNLKNASTFAIY